jgi:hypothetical protein
MDHVPAAEDRELDLAPVEQMVHEHPLEVGCLLGAAPRKG